MTLTEQEQFERWKFISKTHRELHDQRRKYEWRVFFTTITFYVLVVSAAYSNKISTDGIKGIIWSIFILSAILVSVFLWRLYKATDINRGFAEEAEDRIILQLIDIKDFKEKIIIEERADRFLKKIRLDWFLKRGRWALSTQIFLIFLFSISSAFLLINKKESPSSYQYEEETKMFNRINLMITKENKIMEETITELRNRENKIKELKALLKEKN